MSYLLWSAETEPGHAVLASTPIDDVGRLHLGESVEPDFGQPIEYSMNELFPDDIALSDNYERAGQIIISSRLRQAVESSLPDHGLQFLPVTIRNHKGRVASRDYYILHSLDVCDCIDIKKSRVKWNPLNRKKIISCKSLVLDESAIPDDLLLFRLKHWGTKIVASATLAERLLSERFVGLAFDEPTTFTGIG